jgi:hypothetical protein
MFLHGTGQTPKYTDLRWLFSGMDSQLLFEPRIGIYLYKGKN